MEGRLENRISGTARKLVQEQAQPNDVEHREESGYRALCEGFPALLRTAGLTRTVAFLSAKSDSGAEYAALAAHLDQQLLELGIASDGRSTALTWVTARERTTAEYRHVSMLAFRIMYWHKRLSQALLRKRTAEKGVK